MTNLFISLYPFYLIILAAKTATQITNINVFYDCAAPLFYKHPNRERISTSTRLGLYFSGGYLMHHTAPLISFSLSVLLILSQVVPHSLSLF